MYGALEMNTREVLDVSADIMYGATEMNLRAISDVA